MFVYSDINGRSSNQDHYWLSEFENQNGTGILAIVCDGMGGLTHSELASSRIVETIQSTLLQGLVTPTDVDGVANILQDVHSSLEGMRTGSTVTYLVLQQGEGSILHLGDSRAYFIKGNHAVPRVITHDHTQLNKFLQDGIELPVEATARTKMRSTLTRAVGPGKFKAPDVVEFSYESGDAFLLATDGFWHGLDFLQEPVSISQEFLEQMAREDVEVYKERDNITAIGFVAE